MPPADEDGHKNFAKIVIFAKALTSVLAKAIAWVKAWAKAISSLASMSKPFLPLF